MGRLLRWRPIASLPLDVHAYNCSPGIIDLLPTYIQHQEGGLVPRGDDQCLLRRHLGAQVPRLDTRQVEGHPHGALR